MQSILKGVCRKKGLKRFKGLFIVESADLAYPANLQALHSDTWKQIIQI